MHQITFFPLGNADSYLIDLEKGLKLLFDYANMKDPNNPDDRRIDLPEFLRANLKSANRNDLDVVAFTHADDDHVCGMSEFFYLEHAAKYQDSERTRINQLWVPAAVLIETGLSGDARILQNEARHRFRQASGIRVFSRPDALRTWCDEQGIDLDSRRDLISDAGSVVPELNKATHGVEFFVHSPFAQRLEDGALVDRNDCSLVLQATFVVPNREVRFILSADTTWENFVPMVEVTRFHKNEHRLEWDIFKLPHHCSYLSLAEEKGSETTSPVEQVAWLFEDQGAQGGIVVSMSDQIPAGDSDQPPHRQAANYYQQVTATHLGQFVVTMEHPTVKAPEPLVITIDINGPTLKRIVAAASAIATSQQAPRAGSWNG